jgi:hypothetical protein
MEMIEGKDDIASNVVARVVPLALANPSLGSLIARLAPSVLTLCGEVFLVTVPLRRGRTMIS